MNENAELRLGLIGCGRIGVVHAEAIGRAEGARLVAVSDAVPDASAALADIHGAEERDAHDLISSPDIDAVVIASPTSTHADLAEAAARAGKAIFCEKPIDLSAERAEACRAVVEAAGVPFLTAFQRRFDPHIADLAARLHAGEIGRPELVVLSSRDPGPPPVSYIATSGGIYRDMMIHDFDVARFLLGEEPIAVHATGACLVDPAIADAGDVDTAAVTLRTARGAICQITCSRRASYGYDQRIEVHGETGMLSMDNLRKSLVARSDGAGMTQSPSKYSFLERYADAYAAEMHYFVAQLRAGAPLGPDARDGVMALKIADAATLSAAEGRVVEIR
ncbi:MAG: inositol 2-dehydrogenase [Pseudomonadota bacterium]